jgi:hypothetical protein
MKLTKQVIKNSKEFPIPKAIETTQRVLGKETTITWIKVNG